MTSLLAGLYGIYFILVGVRGNASQLTNEISQEKGFIPWAVALLVLAFLGSDKHTHRLVAPLITLGLITILLQPSTRKNVAETYDYLTGNTAGMAANVPSISNIASQVTGQIP